jgi:hypothetical protein
MTNTIDWGEFQGSTGDWQKFRFDNPGDAISGTLVSIRVATMADGTRMPALEIRDSEGTEWSLLAGAVNLQRALSQHRPASGDQVSIVFTGLGEQKTPGKNAPKLFDVAVKHANAAAPAPAPAAPAPAAPSAADLI